MRLDRRLALLAILAGCAPAPAVPPPPAMTDLAPPPAAAPSPAASPRSPLAVALRAPIELEEGRWLEVEAIVGEDLAPAPGDGAAAYPAGSGVTVTVAVAGQQATLSLLSAGYSSAPVAWLDDLRIELAGVAGEVAHLRLDRRTDRVLASQAVRIRQGETIRLHDEVDFQFVSHGHKAVTAEMISPLMVNVDYHDGAPYGWTHSLFPPDDATWLWRDLRFTLGAYHYGDFMELVVDRLALAPVVPASPPR
jgi:hypothetical protein